ncbi:MAG: phosphatidylglycerophosphatase A [Clostridiales bacterium]|jgi:phosphatidylglycerophosphatase A|nr:phosphatidylglycerophosphatase A [Clostridiales bacterium]
MKAIWKVVATCCGIGFIPVAPGTAASLAVALMYKFFLFRLSWPFYLVLFVLLGGLGLVASAVYAAELGRDDPRRIVVDEASGQLISLFAVPASWTAVGLSFFLFRFFDIVKPYPIRRAERLPGGWGIMADDLLAGLIARVFLFFVFRALM